MYSNDEKISTHKLDFIERSQQDKNYEDDIIPRACSTARSFINPEMKNFLDVGCGPGHFGKMVKDMQEAYVVGLECTKKGAEYARRRLDEVHEVDVESFVLPYKKSYFDCLAYFDVLEHLIDPWSLLKKHRPFLKNDGVVIASIPNIRNLGTLVDLVQDGKWSYKNEGILDITHLRFFTWITIHELFNSAGYKITSTEGTVLPLYEKWVAQGKPEKFDTGMMILKNISDEFFVGQFVIRAKKAGPD